MAEIKRLPLNEQLLLLEYLRRNIRETLQAGKHNLVGILATQYAPPSDKELKDGYIDYLDDKYR